MRKLNLREVKYTDLSRFKACDLNPYSTIISFIYLFIVFGSLSLDLFLWLHIEKQNVNTKIYT